MTSAQKVVKYLAYAFACVLAFSIIAGIVAAGAGILTAVGVISKGAPEAVVDCSQYEKCLSLQLSRSELYIKKGGDEIKVETSDDEYEITRDGQNVVVKDKKKSSWFGGNSRKLTVTVPENVVFDTVGITGGAGRIEIEKISAKELNLSLGAGETVIRDIEVSKKVKISAGAGKLAIEDGKINDAKIDLGVGETSIRAAITGDSKVDAGIGSVKLDLLLPESEYSIKAEKGIGEIRVNDSSVSSGSVIGTGKNTIDVDGGIGEIKIRTAAKKAEETKDDTEKKDESEKKDSEKKES